MTAREAAARANETHYIGNPCRVCAGTLRYTVGNTCVACALKHSKRSTKKRTARTAAQSRPGERFEGNPCKSCGATTRFVSTRTCVACNARKRAVYNARTYGTAEYKRKRREKHLRRHYGVGVEFAELLQLAQGDVCAICGTDKPGPRGWHVDHSHSSGEIRGALCDNCNWGLGCFRDDPEKLKRAIDYLSGELRQLQDCRLFFAREAEWLLRQNGAIK